MPFAYSLFGLNIASNRPIPGLDSIDPPSTTDVEIYLDCSPTAPQTSSLEAMGETLFFVSSIKVESGEPAFRIWNTAEGSLLRMEYYDGMRFWLDRHGTRIWAAWPDPFSIEDAAAYILGPVLGVLLRLRGLTSLHASAVAFGGYAVAFAGDEGAGKSTTAAALAGFGHPVISDDIVALVESDGGFCASPAYPYLSLWPASVDMLYGPEKALPTFSANFEKRQLLLGENGLCFANRPLPLAGVFLLGERTLDPAAPLVEKPSLRDALVRLVANSYAATLLDREMRAREFELLGRLVASLPVWILRPHADPSRIDQLCHLIQATVDRATASVPQPQTGI